MEQTFDDRFDYLGLNRRPSWCWLELWEGAGKPPVVIVTNPSSADSGTSITHFAEQLAALVCRRFHLEPRALIWIECYERRGGEMAVRELSRQSCRSDFDRVYFQVQPDGTLSQPEWQPFGLAQAESLVGHSL